MCITNLTENHPLFPAGLGFCWHSKLNWLSKDIQGQLELAGATQMAKVEEESRTGGGLLAMGY